MSTFIPAYLKLSDAELQAKVEQGIATLESCQVCPRDCNVNRLEDKTAVCKTGRLAQVASHFAHFGEEDCLRGRNGSGTIFFNMCNLRCVFCQNYDISQAKKGPEVTPQELAELMLDLQSQGCHNINFVTPEHVVPQIIEAIPHAIKGGLNLPIVYNTSAYDSLESLQLMDGIVDIYMPDFKFWDDALSMQYVKAKDYSTSAQAAIKEMHRQVGDLVLNDHGLAQRGLMIRHLVMPGGLAGTREIMHFIATEISTNTYVNVMAQYYPAGKVNDKEYAEINRYITQDEYDDAISTAQSEGLHRLDPRAISGRRWR